MSELIGILDASRVSADNVREYALDYYVQYGYLPSDIQFDNGAYSVSYTHLTLPTNREV